MAESFLQLNKLFKITNDQNDDYVVSNEHLNSYLKYLQIMGINYIILNKGKEFTTIKIDFNYDL